MVTCKVKKWGNSMGIIIPKEMIEEKKIKEDEEVEVLIIKKDNTLRDSFGMLKGKLKKSGQEITDEMRMDLYDD